MSTQATYQENEEYSNRLRKLGEIRSFGVEPYPHRFDPESTAQQLHSTFDEADIGNSDAAMTLSTPKTSVTGRLVLFRAMGKNIFGQIQDHTGRIQIMFNRDTTRLVGYDQENQEVAQPPSHHKFIEKKFDLGDILGIEGHLFHTGKGELTILVTSVTLLTKSLLPLPDKHAGLASKELRYRKRWLDLMGSDEVSKTFAIRSKVLRMLRTYCEDQAFEEVETPVLQSIYGGAQARPFTTHFNDLDMQMFLRISLEIPLKKLLVGGMNRIFEIGKVFRNEGIDRNHNPEFTMFEAYAAGWDYNDMMAFVENLFEKLALEIHGTTILPCTPKGSQESVMVDFKAPWCRMTMKESLQAYAKLDVDEKSDEELRSILGEGVNEVRLAEIAKLPRGLLIFNLFEDKVEHQLVQPHHITDHPIETTPLCKLHRDPDARAEGIVERFESFVASQEICNSYSELNDPELQQQLLEDQAQKKDAGDAEANPLDHEFLEAICQGMPPAAGLGIGVDRMLMLLTNSPSIRDVILFPFMRKESF